MINGYGGFLMRPFVVLAVWVVCLLAPGVGWSAPIGAKAVYVEGKVTVSAPGGNERAVAVGDPFTEGDRVKTGADGAVEIEFDTGDLIKLTAGTDMVIKALHRSKKGSTFNIFDLALGQVKSMVSKLADKSSRFEYHTRTAIAGVAGTPPWVVTAFADKTEVDLLGSAHLYVMGQDGELIPIESATYTLRNGRLFDPDGREVDPDNNFQPIEDAQSAAPDRRDIRSDEGHYILKDGRLVPIESADVYVERDGQLYDLRGHPVGHDGQPIRRTTETHNNDNGHSGGAVYVQGSDPAHTEVILHPGFRTVVHMGRAPMAPFSSTPGRLKRLRMIPFKSLLQRTEGTGGQGVSRKHVKHDNGDRKQMVVDSIDRRVSVPRTPKGGRSGGQEELESQYNQGQGFAGPGSSNGNGMKTPVMHHGKLGINLN